ncbi:hypothetical protein PDE_03616 [Penicillium oxalicum 114-2]|uniref:SAP domain-containing protein n=1 Tax=Penicillium oxalicum (strain 114-2 / CGMCC 5302) TaxID=933388 RepID=S7ZDD9_PENO1|nr:hypothetical protein PDE_03616 [Penicillium oxalicum 114-2]
MTAPRSTSLRALRQIAQHPRAIPVTRRSLHMTGVQSAQPANPADKASLYAARTLPDLKQECQRRSLRAAGSKSELIERLSNHDVLQSRAFSIAMRRINSNAFADPAVRTFNTSRSHKAVGDTSTVDFIHLPNMSTLDAPSSRPAGPRVPVLPDLYSHHDSPSVPGAPPMKPQIYSVSGGDISAPSPMSEVVDNHAVDIDPFSLTEAVGRSRIGEEMARSNGSRKEPSLVKELWSGFLDDVLGPKQTAARN